MYPLTDDYMVYDYSQHRYILTAKCVADELGIDLKSRLNARRAINADSMIKTYLNQVSVTIHSFIYKHNNNMTAQQYILAKCPSAREIIKEAMKQQLLYLLTVGDVARSTDAAKRALAIDELASAVLQQTIEEYGGSILYIGTIGFCPPSYSEGGY